MCTSSWSDDRYFLPSPEWIWDRNLNPGLTAKVDVRAHLRLTASGGLPGVVHAWLATLGARSVDETTFVHGGTAIQLDLLTDEYGILTLSSGGEDVLESLEDLVGDFHDGVLRPHPEIVVRWEELPISTQAPQQRQPEPGHGDQ